MRTIITDNTVEKLELDTDDRRAALIHTIKGEMQHTVIILNNEERAKVKSLL